MVKDIWLSLTIAEPEPLLNIVFFTKSIPNLCYTTNLGFSKNHSNRRILTRGQ